MEITYYASNDTEQLEVEYPADASSASALVLSSAHTTNPMPISNMAIIFIRTPVLVRSSPRTRGTSGHL